MSIINGNAYQYDTETGLATITVVVDVTAYKEDGPEVENPPLPAVNAVLELTRSKMLGIMDDLTPTIQISKHGNGWSLVE